MERREATGFEGYKTFCCDRDTKVYHSTHDDPLAQQCDECKADKLVKQCIAVMYTLSDDRRLQVITEFQKRV